ncbi:hypothetical protein NDU88_005248 [Pleurodeles waltl]|uniref:BHLH domain-containing protein n=1 Tax=Pleurodeles waltl TaxID=8319 RepID=A0AAV7TUA6_PLEWA|nr:hypothetical protein NDU88_005248 [Pleurodeles waltl]
MASSPVQLLAPEYPLPLEYPLLSECTGAASDSHSSTSSPGSYTWSPVEELPNFSTKVFRSCFQQQVFNVPPGQATRQNFPASRKEKCRVVGTQRHSASEREKLRMRNLSKAVQNLRKYLPPSVVPAGQNLTKIETLRLAIRYISHLSDLLGLSEEALAQQRQEELREYNLRMKRQDCFQALRQSPPQPSSAAEEHSTFYVSSPECTISSASPTQPCCQVKDDRSWLCSPDCCEERTPPVHQGAQYPHAESWLAPTSSCVMRNAPMQQDTGFTYSDSWLTSSLCSKLAHFYHCQMDTSSSLDPPPSAHSTPKHHDPSQVVKTPRRSSANSMLASLSISCLQ